MRDFLDDLRYAVRLLRRRPLVSLAVVAILTVGIGANTVIFRIFSAAFLRPLPFADEDALVRVYVSPVAGGARISPRTDVLLDVRDHVTSFERVVGQRFMDLTLTTDGGPERVTGIGVTEGWAATLGVTPFIGRAFLPDEERRGLGADVAVISHAAWRDRFGGDPGIVGRVVRLDGRGRTIVGVMPVGLRYPYRASFWLPLSAGDDRALSWGYNIQARLRPGVTLEQARAELERVAWAAPSMRRAEGMTLVAYPLREVLINDDGDDGRLLAILFAAVGVLLLIVTANVAHLLLAESMHRRREFALRSALGATGGRTARQLLAEGGLLAVLGGMGGAVAALVAGSLATVLLPTDLALVLDDVPFDGRVFGFTLAISLGTGIAAGLVPAAWVARRPPRAVLRGSEHGTAPVGMSRAGRLLIVSELALALMLLSAAGVVLDDLTRRQRLDLGYDPEGVLTLNVSLAGPDFGDGARRVQFLDAVLERMRAVSGVAAAGAVTTFPAEGQGTFLSRLEFEGRDSRPDQPVIAHHRLVTPGLFDAMGLRLIQGRAIDATDAGRSPAVAVVSRSVAEQYWPGQDPIGQRLREIRSEPGAPWHTVVGVVDDVAEFYADTRLAWYAPLAQEPDAREARQAVFVVRTTDPSAGSVRPLRDAIGAVDPTMAVFDIATATGLYRDAMAGRRSAGRLAALFAVSGLLVAALGVYASVAFSVGSRRREIAVRIALGAEQGRVVREFVRQAGVLVILGLGAGAVAAVPLSRWVMAATGAERSQPVLLVAAGALLAAVALLAGYLPARRAALADPAAELRA